MGSHVAGQLVGRERPAGRLEDGLARMTRWARQHGARRSRAFDDIEIARNLPPVWRTSPRSEQP
jgi:hypothetical protein